MTNPMKDSDELRAEIDGTLLSMTYGRDKSEALDEIMQAIAAHYQPQAVGDEELLALKAQIELIQTIRNGFDTSASLTAYLIRKHGDLQAELTERPHPND